MTTPDTPASVGDVIEVRGVPGAPTRRGTILELLGRAGHEHYRVRWDEEHESLFFPSERQGTYAVHPASSWTPGSQA